MDSIPKPEFLPFTAFPIPQEQIKIAARYILDLDKNAQLNTGEAIIILTEEPFWANASNRTHFQSILLRKISYVINYEMLGYNPPSNLL
jgi:hypothetical protein